VFSRGAIENRKAVDDPFSSTLRSLSLRSAEYNRRRACGTGQAYDESVFLLEDQKQAQRNEKRLRKQAKTLGLPTRPSAA
jgi:hypothetical protein